MGTIGFNRPVTALPQPIPYSLRALERALDDHDSDRRHTTAGVTAADLASDKQLWVDLGQAVAALARRLADGCDASIFCGDRIAAARLCVRLVESIDDQIDIVAWRVIEAAALAAISN